MSKARQAMLLAMAHPETERGRGNVDPAKGEVASSFSYRLVQDARLILAQSVDGDLSSRSDGAGDDLLDPGKRWARE